MQLNTIGGFPLTTLVVEERLVLNKRMQLNTIGGFPLTTLVVEERLVLNKRMQQKSDLRATLINSVSEILAINRGCNIILFGMSQLGV